MLFLLRKIRKSFFLPGKLRTYLAYAFGEIVLIVVGILIAFQINAWSEKKAARDFEVRMLLEIKSALEQDFEYWNQHVPYRMSIPEKAIEYFENYILTEEIEMEEASRQLWNLHKGFMPRFVLGPFEALKSTGLDRISNDNLRGALTYHYDFFYPRQEQLLDFGRESEFERMSNIARSFYEEGPRIHSEDGEVSYGYFRLLDLNLKEQPSFRLLLWDAKDRTESETRLTSEIKSEIRKMIDLVEKEIEAETSV